jgi:hypothetical protein
MMKEHKSKKKGENHSCHGGAAPLVPTVDSSDSRTRFSPVKPWSDLSIRKMKAPHSNGLNHHLALSMTAHGTKDEPLGHCLLKASAARALAAPAISVQAAATAISVQAADDAVVVESGCAISVPGVARAFYGWELRDS